MKDAITWRVDLYDSATKDHVIQPPQPMLEQPLYCLFWGDSLSKIKSRLPNGASFALGMLGGQLCGMSIESGEGEGGLGDWAEVHGGGAQTSARIGLARVGVWRNSVPPAPANANVGLRGVNIVPVAHVRPVPKFRAKEG